MVNRKITETGTTLTFEAPEELGLKLDQKWLNSIFDSFMINPTSFENLSPKEQAIALGIDLSSYDSELAQLKVEYTVINRELTTLGKPQVVEKTEMIDVGELTGKLQRAMQHNEAQASRQRAIEAAREKVKAKRGEYDAVVAQIKELQKRLVTLEGEYNELLAKARELPNPEEKVNLAPIQGEIARVNETNEKAMAYKRYMETIAKIEQKARELADNKDKQDKVSRQRTEAIRSMKLPFGNLSVDKDGNLLLEDKFIRRPFFSTGELKMIILALAISRNPQLRYAFLQDFNLLDDEMQKKIIDFASQNHVQLVIEYVNKTTEGLPNAIMLRDCAVVE